MEQTNPNPDVSQAKSRTRKKKRGAGRIIGGFFKILGTLVLVGIFTCLILFCYASAYIKNSILPNISLPPNITTNLSSTISYVDPDTGRLVEMRTIFGSENRIWVDYEEIPKNLIDATVAIEDKRFWQHHGVDWRRTVNGVLLMFTGSDIQGGSTITQQLIKNMTDDDQITVKRKIMEIFRALEYEKQNPIKEDILELYLNYIYLGENCNGVYTASYAYFGKHVSQLSLAESASLIAITNNPSLYNPYVNREGNKNRQELILWTMYDQEIIDEATYKSALAEELVFQRGEDESRPVSIYTWFEDQVITDVVADLSAQYGLSNKAASNWLYNGGLQVVTTLNPDVQAAVDQIYQDRSNLDITSASGQQLQSSIVIIDNATGNVVALAGAVGEKTSSLLYNMATTARRSPGSSIKPLSVYAPALEMGLITPNSVRDDAPLRLYQNEAYPSNAYLYYRGNINIDTAVTISCNTVAMRILEEIGAETSFTFMVETFGFEVDKALVARKELNGHVFSDIDSAPLALGGLTNGVTALEMATAYSVFARDGVYIPARTYTTVMDSEGNIILDNDTSGTPVLSEKTTYYITNLLQNVVKNGGTESFRGITGMPTAGKTGTTNSRHDRWFVGYTPYYTAAVWTGFKTPERMKAGESQAVKMWALVMELVHEDLPTIPFSSLPTYSYEICADSGMRATEYCSQDVRGSRVTSGRFVEGDQPTAFCTMHSENSYVDVCTECPILDANGEPTGLYHLAGEFCPEESVKKVALLDYERAELAAGNTAHRNVRDDKYLLIYTTEQEPCTVHTEAAQPPIEFDPFDPSTWPTAEEDPNFNILDPSTWPINPDPYEPIDTDPIPDPTPDPSTEPTTPPETSEPPTDEAPDPSPDPSQDAGIGIPIG